MRRGGVAVYSARGPKGDPGIPGPSVWGVITGTLADQIDLQIALNDLKKESHISFIAVAVPFSF